MRRDSGSVDGFIPRRGPNSGGLFNDSPLKSFESPRLQSQPQRVQPQASAPRLEQAAATTTQPALTAPVPTITSRSVSRQEIDDSLRDIHDEGGRRPVRKKGLFGRKTTVHESPSKRKTWTKRIVIVLLLIGLLARLRSQLRHCR